MRFGDSAVSGKPASRASRDKSLYFASGKPGEYRFELVVGGSTSDGKVARFDDRHGRVVGPPARPRPTPIPAPTPDPMPTPACPGGWAYLRDLPPADAGNLLPSHAAMKTA